MPRLYKILAASVLLFGAGVAFAVEDGFLASGKIEGKHFTVFLSPQIDVAALTKQLNITLSDKLLAGVSIDGKLSEKEELADALDILYIRVCDILDMNLYSFKANIKICSDSQRLNGIYQVFFKKNSKETRSFYAYAANTIYTCAENFSREIIGHEIAHAVISNYFVVLPSEKVHEVLAGYVTYQLRNAGK